MDFFDDFRLASYNLFMKLWSLPLDGPVALRLACDTRFSDIDIADDHIWELKMESEEPPSLSLNTTYGSRARAMRIFPGFGLGDRFITDPEHFHAMPVVRSILPDYVRLEFSPFTHVGVIAEYWVPGSHVVMGRFTVSNRGAESQDFHLRLYGLLQPGENPQALGESVFQGVSVLSGRTAGLHPVIFLSGGARIEPAPYPALGVQGRLLPGEVGAWVWAQTAKGTTGQSFTAAREWAGCNWDKERSRVEMENSGLVDVESGDPDWDTAFWLTQKEILGNFVGPVKFQPGSILVKRRSVDDGFSPSGEGGGFSPQGSGYTAVDAFLAISQILPAAPSLPMELIGNFLKSQDAEGEIEWLPNISRKRSGLHSIPLLATLAWMVYQHTEDADWLRQVFTPLRRFVETWFDQRHDRDQDGWPEWDHVAHSGFDDWPAFALWHRWSQGLDISMVETVDLASYLFREIQSLINIAREIGREHALEGIKPRLAMLQEAVESTWSAQRSIYRQRDRDLDTSFTGKRLGEGFGEYSFEVKRSFDPPVRILVRIHGSEKEARKLKILIHSRGRRGRSRVERITHRKLHWFWNTGVFTSQKLNTAIERVEVQGLGKEISSEIWLPDTTRIDQSLLLPLWAGIPDPARADKLISKTLTDPDQFWRPYGIPVCSAKDPAYVPDNQDGAGAVWMFWNLLIGEGLVSYGFHEEAAELVTRLMRNVVGTLKEDKTFRARYNPDQGGGVGGSGFVEGAAPLSLFLQTLGVRLISPRKVWIRAGNPYPWPVTLRWRGLVVQCERGETRVTFPDGQEVVLQEAEAQIVEQVLGPEQDPAMEEPDSAEDAV
ncbi:MAG: hypothetical protein WBB65_04920 [Anaerolineales bacterium]